MQWINSNALTPTQRSKIRRLDKLLFPSDHPYDHPLAYKEWSKYFRSSRMKALLLQKGKKLIGFMLAEIHERTKSLYVVYIGILPQHTCHGYGSQLFMQSIQLAKEQKCEKIVLDVNVNNELAISWYQHRGFRKHRRRKAYYYPTRGTKYKEGVDYDGWKMKLFL